MNIELTEGEILAVSDLNTPIQINTTCTAEDTQDYACYSYDEALKDWVTDCTLISANGNLCVFETTHTSEFQIA